MKGYRIFIQDMMGYERESSYTTDYHIAVREWNKLLQKTMEESNIITGKDDFGEIKSSFKKYDMSAANIFKEEQVEIVCMKAPSYIVFKKGNVLTARVFYDYKCSYEYDEYDIGNEEVMIEEIEIKVKQ